VKRTLLVLVAALAAATFVAPARAQISFPEETDFHNTTFVGAEPETARLAFYRAQEQLQASKPKEAGREILKLLRGTTTGLVHFDDRLVVPVETAALLYLLKIPAEVRAELSNEEAVLEPALPPDANPAALRQFAERHPLSAKAESAWLRAGTLALLSGDPESAAADLERIVHWPRLAPASAAADRTRALAAARLLEAQSRLAEKPVEGALAHWPDAASTIERGGEATRIADLLADARTSGARPPADLTTLLVDDARAARPAFPDAKPTPKLVLKHAASTVRDPQDALQRQRFRLPSELPSEPGRPDDEDLLKDLPTLAPLVLGDRLVTIESEGVDELGPVAVHVRRLADGADLFAPIRSDFDFHLDPREKKVVLEHSSLSASGSKLYVTLELHRPQTSLGDRFFGREPSGAALYVLDLDREGFVEVGFTTDEFAGDGALEGYVFAGPAVESSGRLLFAASRLVDKETECALLAFDARSGAPAGQFLLARGSAVPRVAERFIEDEARRVVASPIALRDGTAYVCTNLGVIAAVRASDLELAWSFRYHRIDPADNERYERHALHDVGPWIGRSPVALSDRVLATPSDSQYLYSLARWPDAKGDLLLNDPIERQTRIAWLGADEKECWFLHRVGQPGGASYMVEATDHDGARHWMTLSFGLVTGVPALSGRFLFLPTDRAIVRLDLQRDWLYDTLAPPREVGIPYPEFGTFGDLAVSQRCLVSTSPLFTLVFEPEAK
jgi:hypothetical protein